MITIKEIGPDLFDVVFTRNDVNLGQIFKDVDGYYAFWPDDSARGTWPSHVLRAIADKLDEMNAWWDEGVGLELKQYSSPESPHETTIFTVEDNGDEENLPALFTDRPLAEEYAKAANGVVRECTVNAPKSKWMHATGTLWAAKVNGRWDVEIYTSNIGVFIGQKEATSYLGHYAGWGSPDPKLGQYTLGHAFSVGQSEEECRKMCSDSFWRKVEELDAPLNA